ncbi:MAG: nucleoside phosphorylase [Dehalococcoidia bacterium]
MIDWLEDVAEDDEEHFTAHAFLNYQLQARGLTLADLDVGPRLVVTFQPFIYAHLLRLTGASESEAWKKLRSDRPPLARGRFRDTDVAVIRFPVGAPAAIASLEEMVIGGARSIVAVGSAGSLQEYAPLGAAVLPTSAIREEGTSYHYQRPDIEARPDAALVDALRDACVQRGVIAHEGRIWTTDAPYREMTSKVRRLAAQGVVAVDMEASALYIVGAMRGLRVASLFIVSDELFHPWRPGFYDRSFRDSAMRIAECALDAVVQSPAD